MVMATLLSCALEYRPHIMNSTRVVGSRHLALTYRLSLQPFAIDWQF